MVPLRNRQLALCIVRRVRITVLSPRRNGLLHCLGRSWSASDRRVLKRVVCDRRLAPRVPLHTAYLHRIRRLAASVRRVPHSAGLRVDAQGVPVLHAALYGKLWRSVVLLAKHIHFSRMAKQLERYRDSLVVKRTIYNTLFPNYAEFG